MVRSPDYKGPALWSVAVVGFVAVVERVLHAALSHKIYLNRIVMMYIHMYILFKDAPRWNYSTPLKKKRWTKILFFAICK